MGAAASGRIRARSGCIGDDGGEGAGGRNGAQWTVWIRRESGVASVINVAARNRRIYGHSAKGLRPSSSVVHRGIRCSRRESLARRFVTGRQVEMDREA